MAARTLLLFGASGFLGPHLVRSARSVGWRVSAASRAPASAALSAAHRPDEWRVFDAEEIEALAPLIEAVRPTAILLAAALARVEECERRPALAGALNTEFPRRVAELARVHGLRCVALSTDLVFGARPPRAERYREDEPPSPVHVYGSSKAAGEAAVLAEDPGALVVRLPLLYGDSFGRGLGASDQVLAALARGERPLLFQDEFRTPLEASNAAAAVVELLARDVCGVLHLAGPERIDRLALARAVLMERGIAADALVTGIRATLGLERLRPRDVSLDAARARALLSTPLLAPQAALESVRAMGRDVP